MCHTPCWHFPASPQWTFTAAPEESTASLGGAFAASFSFNHVSELPEEAEVRLATPQGEFGLAQTCRDLRA